MAKTPQTTNGAKYSISAKVSEKGAVSIYGLQKFPVTLYADQMETILAHADSIRAFMKANAAALKDKQESKGPVAGATAL